MANRFLTSKWSPYLCLAIAAGLMAALVLFDQF